jgi:cysteinyl-tRNA synthetase
MGIELFNTLSREKERFVPIKEGHVSLYTCGFTVYDYAHIGNLRSYIFADILKRTLTWSGLSVKHVENITDVGHLVGDGDEGEDKMEVGARKAGKSAWEIAKYYTEVFQRDLDKANVLSPTIWAPATEYISQQINFIKELEKRGFTYRIGDGIYFDTSKLSDYGKLARLDLSGQRPGARVERNPELRNSSDFALWKFSPSEGKREMEWESPWGRGFPGWHIECSAISTELLGEHFDIHTGGIDHIPVHHTNEIAQNEARFGHKVVKYWLHNNFLTVNGTKMSKSLGNLYTLDDLEKRGFSAKAYRYLCLGTHYRQTLNFTWEALEGAQNAYGRIVRDLESAADEGEEGREEVLEFERAIYDDLNTPQALAVLWANTHNKKLVYKFDSILGLGLREAVEKLKEWRKNIPLQVLQWLDERERARLGKDWGRADELRAQIEKKGYKIIDEKEGPRLAPL